MRLRISNITELYFKCYMANDVFPLMTILKYFGHFHLIHRHNNMQVSPVSHFLQPVLAFEIKNIRRDVTHDRQQPTLLNCAFYQLISCMHANECNFLMKLLGPYDYIY